MAREASTRVGGSWTQVASGEVVELDQEPGAGVGATFPQASGGGGALSP